MLNILSESTYEGPVVKLSSLGHPEIDYSNFTIGALILGAVLALLIIVLCFIKESKTLYKIRVVIFSVMAVSITFAFILSGVESKGPNKEFKENNLNQANHAVDEILRIKYDATIDNSVISRKGFFVSDLNFNGGNLNRGSYSTLTLSDGHKVKVILELSEDGRDITAYPVAEEIRSNNSTDKSEKFSNENSIETSKPAPLAPAAKN